MPDVQHTGTAFYRKLNPESEARLLAQYEAGSGCVTLARTFGLCQQSVYECLKRNGVKMRTLRQHWTNRRIKFDDTFFHKIDSEVKAYWLGFLAADGCIQRNRLQIVVAPTDKSHLAEFANTVKHQRLPSSYTYGNKHDVVLGFCSERLVADLTRCGIVTPKRFRWHPLLTPEMDRHYCRGFIDGDGSFPRCRNRLSASMCGPLLVVRGICRRLTENGIITREYAIRESRPGSGAFCVQFGARATLEHLLGYLYDDATIYLERKYQRLAEWCTKKEFCHA